MKKLKPVNISIDAHMDADDLGSRLVKCVSQIDTSSNVVNLVKIHLGDQIPAFKLNEVLVATVIQPLKEMGANNCVFVPLRSGWIEDITIDHIEVTIDESNN